MKREARYPGKYLDMQQINSVVGWQTNEPSNFQQLQSGGACCAVMHIGLKSRPKYFTAWRLHGFTQSFRLIGARLVLRNNRFC
jgi:hypothetical protein